jgi:hypothetical protein
MLILKEWRMIIVWWPTMETTTTMTTMMKTMTMTMAMRMRMIIAMNTGIAEQSTICIVISVWMVTFVSYWRSYYKS